MSDPTARITPHDVALLVLRLLVGSLFIMHGSLKLFGTGEHQGMANMIAGVESMGIPMPTISAYLAAISEFGGGVLVLLGLLMRLATIPMIFTMGVAFFVAHGMVIIGERSGELALTLGVVLVALLIAGPGKLSLTGLIKGQCCRRSSDAA